MIHKKYKKVKSYQIENQPIFYLAFSMFLLSFGLIFFGLMQRNKTESSEIKKIEEIRKKDETDDVSVQEYFKASEEGTSYQADDPFIKDDPFAELCAPVSGDGIPSVHSNTVCLR